MTTRHDRSSPALSREEVAMIEVGQTTIRPATARFLVFVFLASIGIAPALEWPGRRAMDDADAPETAWSHLAGLGEQIPERLAGETGRQAGLARRIVVANRTVLEGLAAFENGLEDESRIGRLLRPRAQLALSGWLGAGNERVYLGREGWLFYRPEVEYLTGPGFLDPAALARRISAASEWAAAPQPDPREAILQFKRQLDRRGIALVIMPTPLKPTVHPEKLARSYDGRSTPLQNPSYATFVEDLRRRGVLVVDAAAALVDERQRTGRPQYLATDTHWRPEAMQRTAEQLAAFLKTQVALPAVPDPGYSTEHRDARSSGDLARMLDLSPDQRLYPSDTIAIRRVLSPDGGPWRPARSADVLILGDSFTNIFSLASMGWGDTAGFAEQLSAALRRPIDRIVQNDDGAFAARAMLRRELASGTDRLAGKRVVIWQFAARELAVGDWKLMDLPAAGVTPGEPH
jgi:alginate O-acetyltransferase complex protein AlgJ